MITQAQSAMIIAHRGASYDAPENTLAAVNLAWEQNADAVEVDIHYSLDHKIMVIHDKDTKRTSGKKMLVKETLSSVLRNLEGEKIPFIEEVIATIPEGKTLFIEVKTDTSILPYLVPLLESSPKISQIIVISFDWDVCVGVKKQVPGIPVYYLRYTLSGGYGDKWIDEAEKANLDGLNFRYKGIKKEYIDAVHRAGMKMFTWTVDDPDTARKLIDSGIDGITTNRPGWMKDQLR